MTGSRDLYFHRNRDTTCRAPGTLPRRPTVPAGLSRGRVDQSVQRLAPLTGDTGPFRRLACSLWRLRLSCRSSQR